MIRSNMVFAALAVWFPWFLAGGAVGQSVQPTTFTETGTFESRKLDESSGIAVSRTHPGVLWTHNDSGDRARIYATNLEGADLGSFRVRGADANDWEDISLGPCPERADRDCIYIADTGDNEGRRRYGSIYIFPEPTPTTQEDGSDNRTERASELRIRYPNGPRNVEAMATTPAGDLLLITKGSLGPVILYLVPTGERGDRDVTPTAVDTLPILPARRFGNLVTAAAVSPSGQRLAVRTYTEVYFFSLTVSGSWEQQGAPCWLGLRQPQGEALDFLDEAELVLTSETALGRPGGLARAICDPEP